MNCFEKIEDELVVGSTDAHLLKYEATLGYNGYFESSNLKEIYSVNAISLENCFIAGKVQNHKEKEEEGELE